MSRGYLGSFRSPPRFTEQEDNVLVSSVAPTPSLYDPEDSGYRSKEVKAELWLRVSALVKRDVDSCKRRWKDIKNNYFKIKRQHKMDRCRWNLYEKLRFLDPIYENYAATGRSIVSPSNEEEREEHSSEAPSVREKSVPTTSFLQDQDSRSGMDLQPSTSAESSARKRRYDEVSSDEEASKDRQKPSAGDDHVDLFMRSIALQLKKMSPRKIAQAKVRILTIVNELQFGQLRMEEP